MTDENGKFKSRKDRYMKKRKEKTQAKRFTFKQITLSFVILLLLLAVSVSGYLVYLAYTIPQPDLEELSAPSMVFSRDYEEMGLTNYRQIYTPIENISPYLINAIIAVEDNSFYDHIGFDPIAIARASLVNLTQRRYAQGGSTITQQLAKNVFLTGERAMNRKVKELVYAIRIEQLYSKNEILEQYLNTIYFGHGNYGVGAASRYFFNKTPDELTLDEATLLAGIINGPYLFTPDLDRNITPPEASEEFNPREEQDIEVLSQSRTYRRRTLVLNRMLNQEFISDQQFQEANNTLIDLDLINTAGDIQTININRAAKEANMILSNMGYDNPYYERSGFQIITTLDLSLQKQMDNVAIGKYENIVGDNPRPEEFHLGAITIDSATGEILAARGNWRNTGWSYLFSGNARPGSAMKPIYYAYFLENGDYTPLTLRPCSSEVAEQFEEDFGAEITDFTGDYHESELNLRQAMAESCNMYAVTTAAEIVSQNRIADFQSFLNNYNIHGINPNYPASILGSDSQSLLNMVAAYATFNNGGYLVEPYMVQEIRDIDGNTIYAANPQPGPQVISPEVAFLTASLMRSVIDSPDGTASYIRGTVPNVDVSLKTGTDVGSARNTYSIAGSSGGLTTLVSVQESRYTDAFKQEIIRLPSGTAARFWANYMNRALPILHPEGVPVLQPPQGVTEVILCSDSLLLATDNCPDPFTEFFITGTEPQKSCDIHGDDTYKICIDSWQLATDYCPENRVWERQYRFFEPPPTERCSVHAPPLEDEDEENGMIEDEFIDDDEQEEEDEDEDGEQDEEDEPDIDDPEEAVDDDTEENNNEED
ncbi:transglycosylase domain-containing protein [Proteinivorax hydrogeniformans]|uniref:Penicillin-binding protein 1A n=1 Tax=Proteinivorax hydrogeniformans TaxID=1826727 RepID=A0AAU8HT55_9FIRM